MTHLNSSSRPRAAFHRKLIAIGIAVPLLLTVGLAADYWSAKPAGIKSSYVGRDSCVECHRDQADAFAGSHHDLAMDFATEQTVLGDFDDATFEHDGITSRLYRDGGRFMVHTEGEQGEMKDFEVKYVFGVEPLQQYMVEFDRTDDMADDEVARLQVLRISWDTKKQRWFYLRPPDVAEKLQPDDPLHWTGMAQRWQTMCAECHSTNLKRNFDPKSLRYHTTFSEIDVSCEACHGPGSLHVELAKSKSIFWDRRYGYALANLKGENPEPQLQACAPCHSRRGILSADFQPGEPYSDHYSLELLRDDTYFADGQIKDEVYVYGSFIQSKMYHKGIRCTDCHDPHSLRLKHEGNETCTSCHQHSAGKFDVPSHHHHVPGKPGSMCVDCHMPHRTYMDVDQRRDHSLRIPRPDLSVKLGTPNACTGCHVEDRRESIDESLRDSLDEYADWQLAAVENQQVADAITATDRWCDAACAKWYGENRKTPPHFGEAIVAFRRGDEGAVEDLLRLAVQTDEQIAAIARATALSEAASTGSVTAVPIAKNLLKDASQHPVVRAAAISVMMNSRDAAEIRRALMPLIDDESQLVRVEATRALISTGVYGTLSASDRTRIDLAMSEVKESFEVASDRGGAHMGWAMLNEARGKVQDAVESYETAIRVEPNATGPRTNLASLLERMAQQIPPDQVARILKRVATLRAEELQFLGRDAELAPDHAPVQYRYGLALYLAGRLDEAMGRLEKAVELAPDVPDFRTARDLLKQKLNENKLNENKPNENIDSQ